jgi:hypothetical protein
MPYDVCPACGAELTFKEADICWKCGFRLKPAPEGAEKADRWAIGLTVGFLVAPILIAALIAAIVFGLVGGVEKTYTVAATARQLRNDIYVTWQGGLDNSRVAYYNITLGDSETGRGFPPFVGNMTKIGPGTSGQDHVVVTATFDGGSRQVVLDTYV